MKTERRNPGSMKNAIRRKLRRAAVKRAAMQAEAARADAYRKRLRDPKFVRMNQQRRLRAIEPKLPRGMALKFKSHRTRVVVR